MDGKCRMLLFCTLSLYSWTTYKLDFVSIFSISITFLRLHITSALNYRPQWNWRVSDTTCHRPLNHMVRKQEKYCCILSRGKQHPQFCSSVVLWVLGLISRDTQMLEINDDSPLIPLGDSGAACRSSGQKNSCDPGCILGRLDDKLVFSPQFETELLLSSNEEQADKEGKTRRVYVSGAESFSSIHRQHVTSDPNFCRHMKLNSLDSILFHTVCTAAGFLRLLDCFLCVLGRRFCPFLITFTKIIEGERRTILGL